MATPEGQKLYHDVQGAFSGTFASIGKSSDAMGAGLASAEKAAGSNLEVKAQIEQAKAMTADIKTASAKYAQPSSNTRVTAASSKTSGADLPDPITPDSKNNTYGDRDMHEYITRQKQKLTGDNVTTADNMVISEFAYVTKTMEKAVPDAVKPYQRKPGEKPMTIGEYCDRLIREASKNPDKVTDPYAMDLLKTMRDSPRYKDLVIDSVSPYNDGDVSTNIVCVNIGDNKGLIGIQGTNGEIEDWINDAEFARTDPTEEEVYITRKLEELVAENGYDGFYMAGHSQGGRDAITAAAFCDEETRQKLIGVYNLDGPGYSKATLEKYGDLFQAIEDKVRNIYPSGSYVGQILHPIGERTYTESRGDGFYAYLHAQYNWAIDPETGEPIEPDKTSLKYIEGKLINAAVDYATDVLSPEQATQAAGILLRMAHGEDDYTKLDFGQIMNHLDELSAGDVQILAESLLTVGLSAISDVADTVADIASTVEKVCNVLTAICAVIPGLQEVAAVTEAIAKIAKVVKIAAKVVSVVCDIGVFILKKIAEWREKKLAEQRANYKADNPNMHFDYTALIEAATHLHNANEWIKEADHDCDRIRHGFKKEVEKEDNIFEWIAHTFTSIKSLFDWFNLSAADLFYLKSQPNLVKGNRCCNTIAQVGYGIMKTIPNGTQDKVFDVTPSSLKSLASSGSDAVADAKKQLTLAGDEITDVKTSWQGDDYDAFKQLVDKNLQTLEKDIKTLENGFKLLDACAGAYDAFQDRCIEEFQAAAR